MRTIYETVHEGVVGRVIEPDAIDRSRPYAEQLQVWIGVDEEGKQLPAGEFERRARFVVLELQNFLRDEIGMKDPPEEVSDNDKTEAVKSTNGRTEPPVQSRRMTPETLIHSAKGVRWRIDVHRPQGVTAADKCVVFLTGDLGGNIYRSRHMPIKYFREVVHGLEHAHRKRPELQADGKDVPAYPQTHSYELARAELFYVTIALSRFPDGRIEPTVALYDAEDDAAPVLMAIDDEIGDLCRDCAAAIAAAETLD